MLLLVNTEYIKGITSNNQSYEIHILNTFPCFENPDYCALKNPDFCPSLHLLCIVTHLSYISQHFAVADAFYRPTNNCRSRAILKTLVIIFCRLKLHSCIIQRI